MGDEVQSFSLESNKIPRVYFILGSNGNDFDM